MESFTRKSDKFRVSIGGRLIAKGLIVTMLLSASLCLCVSPASYAELSAFSFVRFASDDYLRALTSVVRFVRLLTRLEFLRSMSWRSTLNF